MPVTAAQLLDRVGAGQDAANLALAQVCVDQAVIYVAQYRENNEPDPDAPVVVPGAIEDAAVTVCAEDIWTRTNTQNGIMLTNFESGETGSGVTVRIGRDPLAPARPILDSWYPRIGFA